MSGTSIVRFNGIINLSSVGSSLSVAPNKMAIVSNQVTTIPSGFTSLRMSSPLYVLHRDAKFSFGRSKWIRPEGPIVRIDSSVPCINPLSALAIKKALTE